MLTPWGESDSETVEAEGITFYTTPGHGGFGLSLDRLRQFQAVFPLFRIFGGGVGWFEEDCDYAAVVLAFAGEFRQVQLRGAVATARMCAEPSKWDRTARDREYRRGWESVVAWLDRTPEGMAVRHAVRKWESEHASQWETGSLGGPVDGYPSHCWRVHLRRVGDGAEKTVVMKEYPPHRFLADAEVQALTAAPLPKEGAALAVSGAVDGNRVVSDADPGL